MRECSWDTMWSSTENIIIASKVGLVSEEEPHLAESYECNQEKGGDSLSS